MSRKIVRQMLFAAVFVFLLSSSAQAQNDEPRLEATLTEEMAGIQDSLDRLVSLLEAHLQHQRTELLIRRIVLAERRLEPLEKRTSDAESDYLSRESEVVRLKSMVEQQRDALKQEIRDGNDAPDSPTRRTIEEIERILRIEESEVDEARRRHNRLEDELAGQREEIEVLDEALLEMLE